MNKYRLRAYIYLLTVAAIWGAAAPIIKYTLKGLDPLPFLAYRFFIASIFSLIFFLYKIKKGKQFRQFRANFPAAVLYGILAVPLALGLLFVGLDEATVLDLTLVGTIGPLMVAAGGAYFFRDHITKKEKAGIIIVLVGVLFNSFYPLFSQQSKLQFTGNILLLAYLLADSSSVLVAKRVVQKKVKSANLTNLAFIVGSVILVPLAIHFYGGKNLVNMVLHLPLKYHLGVWYMAFISGNLAYSLYVRGQRTIEVSEAVLFNYLQPIFTIPLALFWLHEKLTTSFIFGAAMITIGLIIAEYKQKKYNKT